MPKWTIAAFTHRGRVRPVNEDTIAVHTRILTGNMGDPLVTSISNDSCVLMIADGMGGHAQGAVASQTVLDYLVAATKRLSDPASCAELIEEANQHLFKLMHEHGKALGMGTTLAGAVLKDDQLVTFNVGDSRAYLSTHGHLIQLSHDDVPDLGANRSGHRESHAITQALGGSDFLVAIDPHVNTDPPLAPGETLLLCSDGLTDMVADDVLREVLSKTTDPNTAVRQLTTRAFRAGGHDNISLVVARLAEPS